MSNSSSFLAVSDVHLGLNLYNQPELGVDLCRLFKEACQLAGKLRADYLVIVGDLYETNKPTPDMIHFVRDTVEAARLEEVRVVGIAGDHDKPVNADSWVSISGIAPIASVPGFVGCDYSDNPRQVMEYLRTARNKGEAEWIFLHGQVPALWPFCEERKKLDIASLPIFELYPKLKGVILGDIHRPYESTITGDKGEQAYVGYCGSLGITCSNEIGDKIGLLHFDGTKLARIPFSLGRDFIKIDLTTNVATGLEIGFYIEKYGKHRGRRPVFLVSYSPATKCRLQEIKPLYQLGFVRAFQVRSKDQPHVQAVSIRSDLNNQSRIAVVLKDLVPDDEVRQLIQETLNTEDPKLALDTFRGKYLS